MAREKLRWAKLFDIPIAEQFPPGFPLNTLQAQRALVAASLVRPDLWEEALAALFHAAWVDRKPVGSFEQVQPIFNLLFGDKATQEIIKKASEPLVLPLVTDKAPQATSQEVKDLLTKQTNHALQSGSFGLPWFIGKLNALSGFNSNRVPPSATNALGETECFWGFDHLGQVTDFLDLQRVTAVGEKESGWRAML